MAKGSDRDEIIENIDIGGPSMVRSAAKNHAYVTIVTDPADYGALVTELDAGVGATGYGFRKMHGGQGLCRDRRLRFGDQPVVRLCRPAA